MLSNFNFKLNFVLMLHRKDKKNILESGSNITGKNPYSKIIIEMKNDIILVCGDRHYDDIETIYSVLRSFQRIHGVSASVSVSASADENENASKLKIIQGGCGGADTIALKYQEQFKLEGTTYKADWKKFGRAAGPFRNRGMMSLPSRIF